MSRRPERVRGPLPGGSRTARRHPESGMVTAETAVVLPVLFLVAVVLAWTVMVAATHIQVVDASREAARLIARGEPADEALAAAQRLAPPGTRFEITETDGFVQVDANVRATLDVPLLRDLLAVDLATSAVTTAEER